MMTPIRNKPTDDRTFISERVKLVKKGKRGRYIARFRFRGMTTSKSLKTSNVEVARKYALVIDDQLVSGTYGKSEKSELHSADIAIRSAAMKYIDHKRLTEKRRPKTVWKYQGTLKAFADWCDGRRIARAGDITVRTFREYEAAFAKTHEPKTTHCCMTIIKGFYIWLGPRGQGFIPSEPLAGVKLPKPRPRPKYMPITADINAIIARAVGEAKTQFKTLAMTGLRVNEMANLRLSDVDLEEGWIHVRVRADWSPKTHEARDIPIHPQLLADLRSTSGAPRPWFFRGLTAKDHVPDKINDRRLLLHLQAIANELHIATKRENAGIVIHSFRDYFETTAVNSRVPQFVIDTWMGHTGGGTMGKTYYGLTENSSKEWMAKVQFRLPE